MYEMLNNFTYIPLMRRCLMLLWPFIVANLNNCMAENNLIEKSAAHLTTYIKITKNSFNTIK
jgi:hypothetical protein